MEYCLQESDCDHCTEMLEGIADALRSGDREQFDHCLEELAWVFSVKIPDYEIKIGDETMSNEIVKIDDINQMKEAAAALMKTGHYKKLGNEGIFAVLQMAKALEIDPMVALNGGLYPVDGKIELSAPMMMGLIRQAGHSVTKDKKSTDTHCILHGKRKDTGDIWTESFGIEDAKKAGLLSRGVYSKYGKDMFQWRALSRLARFLFSDVIKGCYIQGEIMDAPGLNEPVDMEAEERAAQEITGEVVEVKDRITEEQWEALDAIIGDNHQYRKQLQEFFRKHEGVDLRDMPPKFYDRVLARATQHNEMLTQKEA